MAEEANEVKPQNPWRSRLMMIGGALALMAAGAGGGYLIAAKQSPAAEETTDASAGAEAKKEGEAGAEGHKAPEGEGAEGGGEGHKAPEGEGHKTEAEGPAMTSNGTVITNLKTFVVNLRSSGGGRVLRMEVQVESNPDVAPTLESNMPRVRDTVLTAVSNYTFAELEGTDGKTRLKDELLTRINGTIAPQTVDQVYFTQFVVQ